jgi:MraZ protein
MQGRKGAVVGAMFVGVHERQLDEKGRLALPSAFRAQLGDSCYLVIGDERCIDVMPREAFEEMATELMSQARAKQITLGRQRALAHSASLVSLDKQGRVTLDEKMRGYARLTPSSKVMVCGNFDRAEVWSAELYEHVAAAGRGEIARGRE